MESSQLHPRPQLTRRRWDDLCGPWQFAFDDADIGLRDEWMLKRAPFDRTIIVPFPPESPASGIGDPSPHKIIWYRHAFSSEIAAEGERLLLHFGAVDYRATVWINGHHVAKHEGGQTPFSVDITRALNRTAQEQVIVVRAEDDPGDLAQPRGKQDWMLRPHRIWYDRTTGIWQPVWLEPVPDTFLTDIRWTPELDLGRIGIAISLNASPPRPLRLRLRLSLGSRLLAEDQWRVEMQVIERSISLDPADVTMDRENLLWAPEHPNLIDATLTLMDGETEIDEVKSYVGMRSAGVAGGRFLLNGRPYYLRMALEQGFWPESHLAAPSAAALRREVELAKSLGFNGLRIHQKVEDPRFLYWCDRLGLIVWGEMANAYVFSPEAVMRFTTEWLSVLKRDYSHPCIVAWVPLNESWGVPNLRGSAEQRAFAQALYHLTHALDRTRPVIGNDGWEQCVTDIITIHDYASDSEVLRRRYGTRDDIARSLEGMGPSGRAILLDGANYRDEPVMLTEFGGISETPKPGEPIFYGTVSDRNAFLAKYRELVGAVLDCDAIAGFCYTQLTDTRQERNGLLTEDRTPKLDPAAVRAVTGGK